MFHALVTLDSAFVVFRLKPTVQLACRTHADDQLANSFVAIIYQKKELIRSLLIK